MNDKPIITVIVKDDKYDAAFWAFIMATKDTITPTTMWDDVY